jgi:hypothetical protein
MFCQIVQNLYLHKPHFFTKLFPSMAASQIRQNQQIYLRNAALLAIFADEMVFGVGLSMWVDNKLENLQKHLDNKVPTPVQRWFKFPNAAEKFAVRFENAVRSGHFDGNPTKQSPKYNARGIF